MATIDYPNGSTNGNTLVLTDNSTQLQETAGSATQSGVISESGGSYGFTKTGGGTLSLTAANSYTGVTIIGDGTLALSGTGSIATSNSVSTNGGIFDISGTTAGTSIKTLNGTAGAVALGSKTLTITNNNFTIFSGVLQDGGIAGGSGGGLAITSGRLALTGLNTFTGTTTISSGVTLQVGLGGSGALGSGAVVDNGLLVYSAYDTSDSVAVANNISGTGMLQISTPHTIILTGVDSVATTTITSGALQIGDGGTTGTLDSGVITNSTLLAFDRSDNVVITNTIRGNGTLRQLGSGILTLTTAYNAGGVDIVRGTVALSGGGSISDLENAGIFDISGKNSDLAIAGIGGSGTIALGNKTLTLTGAGGLFTLSGAIQDGGIAGGTGASLVVSGGNYALNGIDTYTGATAVNGGILSVNGSIASSGVTVAGGATLGGAGTVSVTSVANGAVLAPGNFGANSIGTLHVSGNLTFASGATYAEELSPSAADTTIVSGTASIGGNLSLKFGAGTYGRGTYTLLNSTGLLTGTFANVTTTGLPSGASAIVTYDAHDVYLTLNNHPPVVTTANVGVRANQTLALSSLFGVSDADGDAITAYELWDAIRDPASGHFVVNGAAQAAGTVIHISAAQLAQASFVTGTVGDGLQIRAFDGTSWSAGDNAAWAPFQVSIVGPPNHAPVVSTAGVSARAGQTLAVSSLFSTGDADGDTITAYELWDATRDTASGHFVVNGVAQTAGTTIHISAAQLAQAVFVTGAVGDELQIRAYDGKDWSAGDTAAWAPFQVSITGPANHAPVMTTTAMVAEPNQALAASSLFAVSDADGDAITAYEFWDATRDATSGHFEVNGVAQAAGTAIHVTAAQLAQTSFVAGAVGDTLQIRAYDGTDWSAGDNAAWAPFNISINHPPVVTTANAVMFPNQTVAASSLFSVGDADGNAMTAYEFWDATRDAASGHFVVNGVVQAAGTVIHISAAQLAQTAFVTGTVADNLQIRAFDGTSWSAADNAAWAPFKLTPDRPPVVTTSDVASPAGRTLAVSSLFSVSDPDGDAIPAYELWDSTRDAASGHFVVNGVAQAAGTVIDVTAAQLAQTSFVTGTVGDNLQIRAFDGNGWSAGYNAAWSPFNIVIDNAPVVTTGTTFVAANQTVTASSLFSVSDADSDPMTAYEFWDSTRDAASGHFVVNGVAQAAGTVIHITATQLAQTSFVGGTVADNLQVRAFDGKAWSAADNASWAPFKVSNNHAPVVTTSDVFSPANQTLTASSLFSVTDADSDPMTAYEFWDSTRDAGSGHFIVNGVAQAAGTVIHITAAQLAQTSFLTGTVADNLQVRAFDGKDWSAADTASWAPFKVFSNHAPVVTTSDVFSPANQTLAASSLFSVSDADSDPMTAYEFWDSTSDAGSGHFIVNGVAQAAGTIIHITAAQLAQTSFLTGTVADNLQVRAFDGKDWSAADSASWAPFKVFSNHPPVVTTADVTKPHSQSVALSSFFSVSDADSDAITAYELWDSTRDAASGHFVVNGVAQAAGSVIDITAAQLAQTSFLTGTVGDNLQIRAYDEKDWSAAASVAWAPFHVSVS